MELIPPTETFGNRDPPPKEANEQYLFLLEFFVHHVSGERLAKLNRMFFVPTRVCLKFLNFEDNDIAVTPVDLMFEPQAGIADDVEIFNSGRSVMFAIARDLVSNKLMDFKLKLAVEKTMPEKIKPDVLVGNGEIDMTKHFAALRKEMLQCWHTNYPPPKIFEGNVDLHYENEIIGNVAIYVRISGFGESIVTEIESPNPEKSSSTYVFKSVEKDDKQLAYKCRLISPSKMDFCKDSRDNFGDKEACQVCQPERNDCSPCGISGGAGKKPTSSPNHDRLAGGANDEREEALKNIFRGKPFTQPWNPKDSKDALNSSAIRQTGNFYEQAKSPVLPIQSSRGPAELCGKAVVLKVSGLLDVEDFDGRRKQPTVTVGAEGDCNQDPEHDVFILRIGKKGLVGAGEKSDIQLEMRTPKGPERRPPIRYETRDQQTEEEQKVTKSIKGKGKGKDKKKKKKKK